jgi:hypothetical protein
MAYQKYNVVLIPSEAVGIQAMEMSRMLENRGGMFVLNGTDTYPHVSLYHVALDPEKVEEAISALREAFSDLPSAQLKQSGYRSGDHGFVGVGYEKDEYLLGLHHAALRSFELLWSREILETKKRETLSLEQQENLNRYGWDAAEALFDPHLTFSRLAEPNPGITAEMPLQNFSFVSDLVGFFELGEHGICTRCLAIFELHKK